MNLSYRYIAKDIIRTDKPIPRRRTMPLLKFGGLFADKPQKKPPPGAIGIFSSSPVDTRRVSRQ